jgi:ribonuclease R
MTDRELVARIARSAGQKAGYKQLVRELSLGGGRERRLLLEQLARLTVRGQLVKVDREHWSMPKAVSGVGGARENLAAGRLDLHRDGYGFVRPNPRQASVRGLEDDIFIPPNEINGAMQGDQVLVEVDPPKADGRRMGRIVRVLERHNPTVVGIFHYANSDRVQGHNVVPFDERMTQPILIPEGQEVPEQDEAATPHRVLGEQAAAALRAAKEQGKNFEKHPSGAKARADYEARTARLKSCPDANDSSDAASLTSSSDANDSSGTSSLKSCPDANDSSRAALRKPGSDTNEFPSFASHANDDLEGLVVDVEITSWPTPTRSPVGRVIEVLGSPDDFGVDVEMMIRKHQLPRIFPENVLAEARRVAHFDEAEAASRRDFRGLPIVTIDGETARDFDDAVLVTERAGGGYELQVHIADVSEYVRAGTDLDLEARLRGTSVYFPDRAIPMLPQELSTGICSLRPGEDRLVLSCLMQLDAEGRIESYEIVEGVIRSAARMTYTEVHAILSGETGEGDESPHRPRSVGGSPDAEVRARYAALAPEFERMRHLAGLMNKRREERGSIDFDLPEPVIEFDEQGQMRGVTKSERTWANRLIEEFMLAANECVATWLEDLGVPSLYRIHEKPEPRRVVQFEELAAGFGYSLGLGALPVKRIQTRGERRDARGRGRNPRMHEVPEDIPVTPRMYQKLAAKIEGKPEERILSYLMLRSLKQARYSEINEGHFALAAPSYTHFTSPIRRYPDLIVHRIAKALLRAGVRGKGEVAQGRQSSPWTHPNEGLAGIVIHRGKAQAHAPEFTGEPPIPESELAQIAEETSQTERRAAEAERELVEWKKVRFMQDRVGEEFSALVLNPAKFGLFVELTDLFVEGLVPIDSLRDDRYTWRENTHEVIGERWGRRFRAGDRVQVILDRILAQERRLQFSIVEEGLPLTGRKPAAKPTRAKKKKATAAPARSYKARKKMGKKGRRR